MRKIAAVFLSVITALSLCACGSGETGETMTEISTDGLPVYADDVNGKVFTIGQWVNVPDYYSWIEGNKVVNGDALTDEEFDLQYSYVKESGINLAGVQLGGYSASSVDKLLAAAQRHGLRQIVFDGDLNNLLTNPSISDSQAITRGLDIVERYKDHPNLAGHSILDEPTYEEFTMLERAYRRYKKIFPDKLFYVNLFPVVADGTVLGPNYEAYVKRATQAMPDTFISYDHYPLKGYTGNTSVISDFLYNMDLIQEYKLPEQEMWTFLQSGVSANTRNPETYADIAWQAYSFMAFGGKGIQWFCYWEVPSEKFNGMINGKGERTNNYYIVQKVNKEILNFDHIFLNYDWQGVLTYEGSADASKSNPNFELIGEYSLLKNHKRIASVSTEQDMLAGAFKEGNNDGFMLVNFADPGKNLSSEVKIKFNDCTKAVVVRHGETKAYALKDGVFSAKLDAGEGAFIIPVA